jgi:hypothetical protein
MTSTRGSENGYRVRSWGQLGITVLTMIAAIGVSWGVFAERISNLREKDVALQVEINSVRTDGSKPTTENTLQIEILKKTVANLESAISRIEIKQNSIDTKLDLILLKVETHLARDAIKP